MERKDDNMEGLIQQFVKEMMTRGFNKFRQANNGRNPGLEDLFDLFEKFKGKDEETNTSTTTATKVRVDEEERASDISKELEIKYLKDQVEQLKQQLKDKDRIIKMMSSSEKKKKKA